MSPVEKVVPQGGKHKDEGYHEPAQAPKRAYTKSPLRKNAGKPIKGKAKEPSKEEIEQILGNAMVPADQDTPQPEGKKAAPRSTEEEVEFRRTQVHRLMLRGVSRQAMAEYLKVSIRVIYDDVVEINKAMRVNVQSMDYPTFLGQTLAFYDEARNMALREASDTAKNKSLGTRMFALRAALAAEDSKHNFLQRVGLYRTVAPTDPFNDLHTGRQGSYSDEQDGAAFLQLIALAAKGQTIEGEVAP